MNSPFAEISEKEKINLFKILESHIYTFKKDTEILPTLKNENIICILLEGYAHIINTNYNGEEYLIEELDKDSVFGSTISNLNSIEYEIRAIEESTVLVIDYNKLINKKNTNYNCYNKFVLNILNILNDKLTENNNRIKILTQKSIRDKLLTFFENEYRKNHSRFIYLPDSFKHLADYLSVNRSAMFRELKYLKDDNFIKVDGKRITLLYIPTI